MKKLGSNLEQAISKMGGNSAAARINMRTHQVRERYKQALQAVYHQMAPLHLAHTNSVIIRKQNGVKKLIVYVDDSLFAAELNAQRELIKLHLLEAFGEEIDDFQIETSKTKKYREVHPYTDNESDKKKQQVKSIPLDSTEKSYVNETVAKVEDKKLAESLKRAMTADLEWKKGEKVEAEPKNTK